MFDALVISDLHLGSEVCCVDELIEFLESIETERQTKRLILNGDVFDSQDFTRLKKKHWKVLSLIRKLSDQMEIVWVAGNHDGPAETVSHLLGVHVADEYTFNSRHQRILVQHGHTHDDFIGKYPLTVHVADYFYNWFQKVDRWWFKKKYAFCRWLKRNSKTYLRVAAKMRELAIKHARERNKTIICCGHSHQAEVSHQDGISYYNSGCWTENPCNYISVKDGEVKLESFDMELL